MMIQNRPRYIEKAQILCDATGVELGNLINIDYNWGEIDFTPDDIDASDTATFVWEIR